MIDGINDPTQPDDGMGFEEQAKFVAIGAGVVFGLIAVLGILIYFGCK